jgi:hypothetical protein
LIVCLHLVPSNVTLAMFTTCRRSRMKTKRHARYISLNLLRLIVKYHLDVSRKKRCRGPSLPSGVESPPPTVFHPVSSGPEPARTSAFFGSRGLRRQGQLVAGEIPNRFLFWGSSKLSRRMHASPHVECHPSFNRANSLPAILRGTCSVGQGYESRSEACDTPLTYFQT